MSFDKPSPSSASLARPNLRPRGVPPAGPRICWLDDEGIARLPEPAWLVDQVLPAGGLSLIYGKPDHGKTFVALDLALCIATGTAWHGHEVQRAPTAYVIGEGQSWITHRLDAWKVQNEWAGRTGAFFTVDPLSLMDERDVTELIASLQELPQPVGLVVLDTMNRTMGAGDESKTQDMTAYVAGCDQIRHATGAHAQVLHHSGWENNRERGSSVFRGAADTVIEVAKDGTLVTVAPIRQRNGLLFEKVHLRLVPRLQSCALEGSEELGTNFLSSAERCALEAIGTKFRAPGAESTEWWKASGLKKTTFHRVRTALLEKGYVDHPGSGRGARYRLTARGSAQVGSEFRVGSALVPGTNSGGHGSLVPPPL